MTERLDSQSPADKPSEPSTDQPKLMISTRLQKSLIANLKAIAKIRGVKYQALIRQVLTEYIAETKPAIERRCPACGMDDKTVCYDARCPYEMRAERPTARSAVVASSDIDGQITQYGFFMRQHRFEEAAEALVKIRAALAPQSASEAFRPSAAAVAKAREYMGEPAERNSVKNALGKMGRSVNGSTEEGELLSTIIDDGEVLAREILRLDRVTNSPSDRRATNNPETS